MITEDFLKNYTELISSGSTPKGGNKVYLKEGKILFFRGQNILMNKFSDHDSVYISNEIHNRMKRTWVKKGDVLLVITGSIGRTAVYEGEDYTANVNQHVCIIRLKDFNVIDPYYLSYYLASPDMQRHIMRISIGATRPALNFSQIGKFKIPIPTIETQKKIVEILEKAEKLKEWRAEADELADGYLKSVFLEMFGDINLNNKNWDIKKISDIADVKTGGTPSRKINEYWENGDVPWVKTTEVNGSIIKNAQEFITKEGLSNSNATLFPKDTILVAMYGQGKTRGKCGKLGIYATTNQACAAILPSNKYNTDYLWYFLDVSYENLRELGRGGNQPNLNLSMIKNFEVPIPPITLQNQFAQIVQQIESLKTRQSQSKQEIDNLFNTLMQKAFKGELVC